MFSAEVEVRSKCGLHARPAAEFVKCACKFKSKVTIIKQEKQYNGKSMIAVISAGIKKDDRITLSVDGEDEIQAVKELVSLIENVE